MGKRTVLIDADICAMESACQGQKAYDWEGDGEVCVVTDPAKAEANLAKRIETIREAAGATDVVIALSDPGRRYFRHDLWPDYKGHRRSDPPELLGRMKQWLMDNHRHYSKPMLEADDVLGILATTDRVVKGEKVVASSDKDLLQIPGLHIDPRKIDDGVFERTEEEGRRWHLVQTLWGDTTDNYPGCPNTGEVRSPKIIEGLDPTSPEAWAAVVARFVERGKTPEYALLQARIAYILQAPNWNFKRKELIPWEPPQ